MKNLILCQIIAVVVLFTTEVHGGSSQGYWPTWRGPNMMGISPEGNPPVKWSESENIKWKVKLTGDGSDSSPIIWKDKIIFQTAVDTNKKGKMSQQMKRIVKGKAKEDSVVKNHPIFSNSMLSVWTERRENWYGRRQLAKFFLMKVITVTTALRLPRL